MVDLDCIAYFLYGAFILFGPGLFIFGVGLILYGFMYDAGWVGDKYGKETDDKATLTKQKLTRQVCIKTELFCMDDGGEITIEYFDKDVLPNGQIDFLEFDGSYVSESILSGGPKLSISHKPKDLHINYNKVNKHEIIDREYIDLEETVYIKQ